MPLLFARGPLAGRLDRTIQGAALACSHFLMRVALTGVWSYSGQPIAAALLEAGHEVLSLTNRHPPADDPFGGRVRAIPYGRFSIAKLYQSLQGCKALHSGYWVRHDKAPIGHRGPWTSHAQAVDHSAALIEAASIAGVRRLVWTSIANPGLDPDLSYYQGKAEVERLVRESGIPYAILRPACFFGRGDEDILIQNVAWAARRLPWFPIPSGPPYWIRPIHVDDFAALVVEAISSDDSWTRDAAGPDRIEFGAFIDLVARLTAGRGRAVRLPLTVCRALYAVASRAFGETILTSDELRGLARNRLDSTRPVIGTTSLIAWLEERAVQVGLRFAREPQRSGPLPQPRKPTPPPASRPAPLK